MKEEVSVYRNVSPKREIEDPCVEDKIVGNPRVFMRRDAVNSVV